MKIEFCKYCVYHNHSHGYSIMIAQLASIAGDFFYVVEKENSGR